MYKNMFSDELFSLEFSNRKIPEGEESSPLLEELKKDVLDIKEENSNMDDEIKEWGDYAVENLQDYTP